ncbi:MAG: hypothetical protein PVH24_01980 [Candidatus Zixiibacteriota bacterium]|jgi:hypothetical protein
MRHSIAILAVICLVILGGSATVKAGGASPRSPEKATHLSFLGTVVPVVAGFMSGSGSFDLIFLGAVSLGPGLGHLYAANLDHFFIGLGLRTLGFLAIGATYTSSWNDTSPTLQTVGWLTLGTVSVYDIVTAGGSARKYNEKHGLAGFDISPTYFASQKAFGVQVSLGF